MRWQQWVLPHIARLRLREKVGGVNSRQYRQRNSREHQPALSRNRSRPTRNEMQCQHECVTGDNESSLNQPTAPLWSCKDQMKTFRVFEIPDQQPASDCQKTSGEDGSSPSPNRI